jgi:UDP-glucose 4-epimerase
MPRILVTGGAGYIGSHTVHFLLREGFDVVVVDDLSRGYSDAVPSGILRQANLLDQSALKAIFQENPVDAVIHFAAFIAVGESTLAPQLHYQNNVAGSIALANVMLECGVLRLVFSSTAAVYGNPTQVPIPEHLPYAPVNPYGETKVAVEKMLRWLDEYRELRSIVLRYFNACGAEPESGLGERHDPETHLIPLILRAVKTGHPIKIFGDDYSTVDGTCVRDYIHVSDLASAHVLAVRSLLSGGGSQTFNVGTGSGFSVRQVIDAAERVTGKRVPFETSPRRSGDPAELVADSSQIRQVLGWQPRYTEIDRIVETAWAFEKERA